MRSAGVDLAAEPGKTALAEISWSAEGAQVTRVQVGAADDALLALIGSVDKTGIDCPFGWPVPFVQFVEAHRAGSASVPEGQAGLEWRRTLAFRSTDIAVWQAIGRPPLSVAADRIGHTAMRCAALLAELTTREEPVDRSGAGSVAEVYPAASLQIWGLASRGYKGHANAAQRHDLVDSLMLAAPWLELGAYEGVCRQSDDALDAVLAALTARAAWLGRTTKPSPAQLATARAEGWVAMPVGPIDELIRSAPDNPISDALRRLANRNWTLDQVVEMFRGFDWPSIAITNGYLDDGVNDPGEFPPGGSYSDIALAYFLEEITYEQLVALTEAIQASVDHPSTRAAPETPPPCRGRGPSGEPPP